MFKAGEKVIHHRYGEGVLVGSHNDVRYPLAFKNNEDVIVCDLRRDGKHHKDDLYPSIYYVPQTFDLSKPEPEIGTWGYFWDDGEKYCVLDKVIEIYMDSREKYRTSHGSDYEHFSPEIPPHIKELMNGTDTSNS